MKKSSILCCFRGVFRHYQCVCLGFVVLGGGYGVWRGLNGLATETQRTQRKKFVIGACRGLDVAHGTGWSLIIFYKTQEVSSFA